MTLMDLLMDRVHVVHLVGARGSPGRCTWCTFAGQKGCSSGPWCCSSLPPRCAEAEAAPQLPRAREEEEDLRIVRPSYCSTPVFGGTYPGILGYVPRFSGVRRDLRFSRTVRRAPASPAPAAR